MNKITDFTGITLGYAMSGLSYFKNISIDDIEISGVISILSFLVASGLTITVAYKNYQDGKFTQAQRRRLEHETDKEFGSGSE